MATTAKDAEFFEKDGVLKLLWKIAPPVMFAQLVQALYNIVDSWFIGSYSADGLTALSVIFPVQWLVIALATGTGVGVNTLMAAEYAKGRTDKADQAAATGFVLEIATWAVFCLGCLLFLPSYIRSSASSAQAVADATTYGVIVCGLSIGTFLESHFSKVHQASGNMRRPMAGQIAGAVVNIVLDPLFIFVLEMGVAGAAWATVAGQFVSALVVLPGAWRPLVGFKKMRESAARIYKLGIPNILMQALASVYIVILNLILAGFGDAAVTVLGLYYKVQAFFFIPIQGLQTCLVPALSYNASIGLHKRCRSIIRTSIGIAVAVMALGTLCFVFLPEQMLGFFTDNPETIELGKKAFPLIGASFPPAVFALVLPVFFQAIGKGAQSVAIAITRQFIGLIPLFWLLSKVSVHACWAAFPLAETLAGLVGMVLYVKQTRAWEAQDLKAK